MYIARASRSLICGCFLTSVLGLLLQAQNFATLVTFDGTNGAGPVGSLVQGRDGGFYGSTTGGGANNSGTLLSISPLGKLTTLHSFCAQPNCVDGSIPYAGLTLSTHGGFYGTTGSGGAGGWGTVFGVGSNGLVTLHSFSCQDNCDEGIGPEGAPTIGTDGALYGTTRGGGINKNGTVFRVSQEGSFGLLYKFDGTDGSEPIGSLVQGPDGRLYGATSFGGIGLDGTVFAITQQGVFRAVHKFIGSDGSSPSTTLLFGSDGNLYGGTALGVGNGGTIYRITPDGELTTLYSFCVQQPCTDGSLPSVLIQGNDGNFYGTTIFGGDFTCGTGGGCGTVFRLTPSGTLTTIYTFEDATPTAAPQGLVQGTDGKFYGTTFYGGSVDEDGTVFTLDLGLSTFVAFVRPYGKVSQSGGILGQGFIGTASVVFNGVPASFKVVSDTYLTATVPPGATTGYVTVTTRKGTLTSNKKFVVLP